jgi:hypothetical protein
MDQRMKHSRTVLILAPAVVAAVLWARSYVATEQVAVRRAGVVSQDGALYVVAGDGFSPGVYSHPAGTFGIMEVETGTAVRRWLPVHVWFVTSVCVGVPTFWAWRKGPRDAAPGFEVSPATSARSATSAPTACARPPKSAS